MMNHPTSPQGLLLLQSSASKWDNKKCTWKSGGERTCEELGMGQRKNSYLKQDISSLASSTCYI